MSKARELAELGAVYDSGALSNRNKIINGAFQVWQRGTSQTGTNSYSSVDRWVLYTSGNGLTASQSTDVPSNSGLHYSIATTGTPSGEYILAQGVELPATGSAGEFYNGQKITISYYAKSSVAGDKLRHFIAFRDTVTGSSNQSLIENNTDQNDLTTSYQRFSKTYTISVDPNGTNTNLCVMIRTRNSANDSSTAAGNITIAGVQLELGTEATPFEHRSFGQELALCERYFQKYNYSSNTSSADTQNTLPLVAAYSGGTGYAGHKLTHTMRTSPTFSASAANTWVFYAGGSSYTPSEMTAYETGPSMWGQKYVATSNFTTGHAVYGRANSTSSYYQFDAEL